MKNVVKILPSHVANQIAAGEVVQRPASVVKELIENSVDAGASNIQLILKDAGKNLIQVIDNGVGMTKSDAEMSFIRHATSKISVTEDIFNIKTKGFRGEALPSIASVSQTVLQTKKKGAELGVKIELEGSKEPVLEQVALEVGTNIQVKNIFFNIPARRKFLKSNGVELKHCIDQFIRIALIHPEIAFKLVHNRDLMYDLKASTHKQRVIHVLGKQHNDHLIPVETETDQMSLTGFVLKPKAAKKTRGDQYLFVNNRFIKSPYLHHAIATSFEEYMPEKYHPGYVLSIHTDPANIDVNIHPTKTEVKFENEKILYAIVKSAVQKSIAQYGVSPSLDFNTEQSFNVPFFDKNKPLVEPLITTNENFNPFDAEKTSEPKTSSQTTSSVAYQQHHVNPLAKENGQHWERLYEQHSQQNLNIEVQENSCECFQIAGTYIVSSFESSMIMIHQSRAHERILFEKFSKRLKDESKVTQQLLFPEQLEFSSSKYAILAQELGHLQKLGFDVEPFGKNTLVFRGIPTDLEMHDLAPFIDELIQTLEQGFSDEEKSRKIIAGLSFKSRTKPGTSLTVKEMSLIIKELFQTSNPEISPRKERIFHSISRTDIEKFFK